MLHYLFSLPFLFLGLKAQDLVYIAVGQFDHTFTPSVAYANIGDIVTFEWFEGAHNVLQMNDDGCTNITMNGFTSGPPVEEPGKIFTVEMKEQGNIWYSCQNYCELNDMKGRIVVAPRPPSSTSMPVPTATATATTGVAPFITLPPYPSYQYVNNRYRWY